MAIDINPKKLEKVKLVMYYGKSSEK